MSSWEALIVREEITELGKCIDAAAKAGKTPDEAGLCNNGSIGCSTCPWSLPARIRLTKETRRLTENII